MQLILRVFDIIKKIYIVALCTLLAPESLKLGKIFISRGAMHAYSLIQ